MRKRRTVGARRRQRRHCLGRAQRRKESERVRLRQIAQQHRNAVDDRILFRAAAAAEQIRACGLHREQLEAALGVAPAGGADEVYAISASSFFAAG